MTWFENLTGCSEVSPAQVRQDVAVDGPRLRSHKNGRAWRYGTLETPTLAELRDRVRDVLREQKPLTVREVVGDVQTVHADEGHANALFQVASQFNLLEMASPNVTPERGVGIYQRDRTQGPACAVAAGAGTIFRNYFVEVDGHIGQSADHQIDCLAGVGALLGNTGERLWRMVNGYALPSAEGLQEIDDTLRGMDVSERDRLKRALRIGLQWDTEVTLSGASHLVSQAFCSALPVAYATHPPAMWARLARLILEASYEATVCAAILKAARTKNSTLFLTLLGGGSFGNDEAWIIDAMRYALSQHRDGGLDGAISSHSQSQPCVQELVRDFSGA